MIEITPEMLIGQLISDNKVVQFNLEDGQPKATIICQKTFQEWSGKSDSVNGALNEAIKIIKG